jgi:hypothetical protein
VRRLKVAEFNVADGTVGMVFKTGSPFALYKGYQDNTWFYAPRAARVSRRADDKPMYSITRNRKRLAAGGGLETMGGVFACQIELVVPVPTVEEQKEWTEHIELASGIRPTGAAQTFRFQPMRLRKGRLNVYGVNSYVDDPSKYVDIPVGASASIPITLELNAMGADTFVTAVGNGAKGNLPVTARLSYVFDQVVPECRYKLTVDGKKTFDYFSVNAKARASYYGWVGGQADLAHTRSELQNIQAVKIEWIKRPSGGMADEQIKRLETAIIDSWIKSILDKIIDKPQIDPAVAPDPKGFFGGVSVSLKSFEEVQDVFVTAEYTYTELHEELFDVSYVFDPLLGISVPADHLTDVVGDNMLPISINLGKDTNVYRYTGQYGYRKADGTYMTNSYSCDGQIGGTLPGVIQFAVGEPMPETTEITLSVEWNEESWEDRTERVVYKNAESGVNHLFSPGNNLANIQVLSDLEREEKDTIAFLSYRSVLPDHEGKPVKNYSGNIVYYGNGSDGAFRFADRIVFPYRAEQVKDSKLRWEVTIIEPDGSTREASGEIEVTEGTLKVLRGQLKELRHFAPTETNRKLWRVLSRILRADDVSRNGSSTGAQEELARLEPVSVGN